MLEGGRAKTPLHRHGLLVKGQPTVARGPHLALAYLDDAEIRMKVKRELARISHQLRTPSLDL